MYAVCLCDVMCVGVCVTQKGDVKWSASKGSSPFRRPAFGSTQWGGGVRLLGV